MLATVCGLIAWAGSVQAVPILYVSHAASTVLKYDAAGAATTVTSSGLNNPTGLAFDASGNLFVASRVSGIISKITPLGVQSTFFSGLSSPTGLAFDTSGDLYVANQGSGGSITKITPAATSSLFATTNSVTPFGLAFDTSGNLFAAYNATNTIQEFSSLGVNLGAFATAGLLSGPHGLVFDSAGNLYASNFINNTIVRYTPAGVGSVFASTGLLNPYGLAFDPLGNLYAANAGNGTIEKFSSTGTDLGIFASGLNSATFWPPLPCLSRPRS